MNVILDDTEHDSNLIKSVASFFEKEDYLDVMFICKGGKKVKAHKLVLSAVSPFLKALFSEWNENQEIVLMVPDIDHNILKLVFVFMYEGTMKLSPSEFVEFKAILKMLKIKFPGAIVDERPVQAPPNRLPPLLKLNPLNKIHLERQTNVAGKKGGDTSVVNDSSSSEVNQPFSTMQDSLIPDRRPKDPDADPLDVPDFYFVPTSTAGAATSASITHATDALNSSGLLMNQEKEESDLGKNFNLPNQQGGVSGAFHSSSDGRDSNSKRQNASSVRKRPHSQIASNTQNHGDTTNMKLQGKKSGSRSKGTLNNTSDRATNSPETSSQRTKSRKVKENKAS